MIELKAFEVSGKALFGRFYTKKVYDKDEVDKVIADLEESHCKEVSQFCISIAELKKQVHDYAQGLYVIQARGEKESRHHKYKRCLDKAEYCKVCSTYYFNVSEIEKDEDKVAEYRNISDWYDNWEERWLELAEKLKNRDILELSEKFK